MEREQRSGPLSVQEVPHPIHSLPAMQPESQSAQMPSTCRLTCLRPGRLSWPLNFSRSCNNPVVLCCAVLSALRGVVWCGMAWCRVVWCGVMWCGVVWCGVAWRGVGWRGVVSVWCVARLGVIWRGLVWFYGAVVWCDETFGHKYLE